MGRPRKGTETEKKQEEKKKHVIKGLSITDIQYNEIDNDSNLVAFVNLTFNGGFVVKGFKFVWSEKKEEYFLANPSTKSKDTYYDDAFFMDVDYAKSVFNFVHDFLKENNVI